MRIRDMWFDITEWFSYEWWALKQSFVMRRKSLQDCYNEGYKARENGLAGYQCPYPHNLDYTDKRMKWAQGWRASLDDDLDDM